MRGWHIAALDLQTPAGFSALAWAAAAAEGEEEASLVPAAKKLLNRRRRLRGRAGRQELAAAHRWRHATTAGGCHLLLNHRPNAQADAQLERRVAPGWRRRRSQGPHLLGQGDEAAQVLGGRARVKVETAAAESSSRGRGEGRRRYLSGFVLCYLGKLSSSGRPGKQAGLTA